MSLPRRFIPFDAQQVHQHVQDYLKTADLTTTTTSEIATYLNMPYSTVANRLKERGTTILQEKENEKVRRLKQILEADGKINTNQAAEQCGFSSAACFFLFFKRVMGKTFTQYRMEKKQDYDYA